ncbi:dihydrodipicolinate reductase [Pseudofrankia sp. BMG5.37]|uniref:NAD(P)H-dependent amine dehydrogenase family protein n=1 Tax=Pseudofrankia sp. BMG5.37 TaxID=3050035 RepID=UPI002895A7A3|nr:dihydrodipicolinate reductase [Pseudofrankia sp. BMG5.37]MDT3440681.1 dihydrodipicolinate reductase [Pseudofrankia sp. BMG5.37]
MATSPPLRVIQWAMGSIGQISVRHMVDNPAFEVVGCYVTSDEKDGRDVGELAGIDPVGVVATRDAEALLALDADCVNYAPLYVDLDEIVRILRSGKNLVTPSGFTFPAALDADVRERLEAACQEGGVSLFGSGIHPGFAGDLLPLTFARLASRIDELVVQEVGDFRNHPSAAMIFDGLGFGRDPDDLKADPPRMFDTMGRTFKESIYLLASGLGIEVEDYDFVWDTAVAVRDVTVRAGSIKKGHVAGMRLEWRVWNGGKPVVIFRSYWRMDDTTDPDWGYENAKYALYFTGLPSFRVNYEPTEPGPNGDIGYWGRIWTAMAAVNAIPTVVAAPAGLRTHLDLPLTQPPHLHR